MPTPRRPRRLVLVGIVTATTLSLGGSAVVEFRADANWHTMQAVRDELQTEWDAMASARPVAGETTGAGNAFAAYAKAAALAREQAADDYRLMVAMLRESDEQVATTRTELLARWRPVVLALAEGASAPTANPPRRQSDGADDAVSDALSFRWVANAAVFAARAHRHAGDGGAAVDETLHAAMLGADLMRRGVLVDQMVGCAILAIATGEAWTESALRRLDRKALDRLANGLERIDRGLPGALDLTGELLFFAQSVCGAGSADTSAPFEGSWRYGFSARWVMADAFLRLTATMRGLQHLDTASWPRRRATLELELAALEQSGNPVLPLVVPNLASAETTYRQSLAILRLLRMAVDRHRDLDLPPLHDPLGDGPIRVTHGDHGVQFASEGANQHTLLARRVDK